MDAAVRFLDAAALNWQKERKCFACHSDFAFPVHASLGRWDVPAHEQIRANLERRNEKPQEGKHRVTRTVMAASVLAQNDALTTGKLQPITRTLLDRMWEMQREDGGFDWMKYDQPPSEFDDHYGVTVAAIGVGAAPDGYAETAAAKAGLAKIRKYFKNNPAENLHHRAMLFLASQNLDGIMTEAEGQQVVEGFLGTCRSRTADGAW
jgi:squalene-hopene/tetraprenyl-beta-curcumene cyclase